jgi:Fe2+ or Zn2+ uptake regulation protein
MRHGLQQEYEETLERNGARKTKQKQAIFEFLILIGKPVYIHDIARALPEINRSTIYRVLDGFIKISIVKQVPRGFINQYEIGERFYQHHHHVICEKCGKTVAVNDEMIEKLIRKITFTAGMKPTRHHIELYGICKRCANNR